MMGHSSDRSPRPSGLAVVLTLVAAGALLFLGPLAWAPAQQTAPAAVEGGQNLFQQQAPGLLVRREYRSEDAGPVLVEVWDLLVGPGKSSEPFALPGAAVITIRSGNGVMRAGDNDHEMRMGSSVSIPDGAPVSFDNSKGRTAIAAQAILVTKR